jgi:hypothetical protein
MMLHVALLFFVVGDDARLYMQRYEHAYGPFLVRQADVKYTIELDDHGRRCPTGEYVLVELGTKNDSWFGRSQYKYANSIDIYSPYAAFRSGRMVYYVNNSRNKLPNWPDASKIIVTIDDFLVSEIIDISIVSHDDIAQRYKPKARNGYRLLDLPGKILFSSKATTQLIQPTIDRFPKQPAPFVEQKTANAQEQRFVADYSQRFAIRFRHLIYTVVIDEKSGEYRFEDFSKKIDALAAERPALPPWLLEPKSLNESVYEHHQGKLIPGFIHQIQKDEWVFVPDIGGKIIDMAEYLKTYQPWSRRIYNLPGKFVAK